MLIKQIIRNVLPKYKSGISTLNGYYVHQNSIYVRTLTIQKRNFHLSKTCMNIRFRDTENDFVFHVIKKDSLTNTHLLPNSQQIIDESTFNLFLNRNWRSSNATDIVEAFKIVKQYCVDNNINVSDPRFDSLVDGLMDHCDKLTDNELLELLTCLSYYPLCPSYLERNYHDIWSCLDDMCCWRMHSWDIDTLFNFGDAWYKLYMGKICDFIFQVLDRLPKKADKLTKDQLVHIFFYFNICRNRPVDFEYESALEHKINEMTVDEMGVVALGCFKTKSKIKIVSILQAMIQEVTRMSMGVHEITLTAIMKILRFSNSSKLIGDINKMLDSLYPELDRFSELCCLHIALLSTGLQTYHKKTLSKCTEKILQDLPNTRLKNIERILNVLTQFNFHPKTTPDIFQAAYEEIHKDSRIAEMNKYPRCLPCALNYFSLRGIYSYELMNRMLDPDFITLSFGKQAKYLPRELLSLDACIDVECPDYKGNRLPLPLKYKATKWYVDFPPSYNQWKKISPIDQLMLDTLDAVKKIVKNEEFVFFNHVLPHYPRPDIIICQDTKTGKYVKPLGFERYVLGDVMVPFTDEDLKWYAIVVLGWNNTIMYTSLPVGQCLMKERQLAKIGYIPVMVIWNQFQMLSPEEKEQYILQKLA